VATVPAKAERIHARIDGSTLRVIPGAGHSATIEEPEAINRALQDFLTRLSFSSSSSPPLSAPSS